MAGHELLRVVTTVLGAAVVGAFGLSPGASPEPACGGFVDARPSPARAARVLSLARSTPEGRRALAGVSEPEICFDPGADARSVVVGPRTLVLVAQDDDRRLAARAAHLSLHRREASLFGESPSVAGCDAWLSRVLAAEREAHATEAAVARELAAPAGSGESLEELAVAYRARCR
ncbi:MAG: hypothetical protein JNL38_37370 [Myxococcales bacterium]|nr:hypothetical protein [Myxococcales bacterium]